jgi:aminoglycoside phosphotransferase (APT) family kinase protein
VSERSERSRGRLVHGDFRNGNLIGGPDGLRAVLDWELAHLGDPLEDLGWLCVRSWRCGAEPRVGGFGPVDDQVAAYADPA